MALESLHQIDAILAGKNIQPSENYSDEDNYEKNEKLKNFNYATGHGRSLADTGRDVLSGITKGLGKGGQLIGDLMEEIPGFKNLQQGAQKVTGIKVPRVDFNKDLEFIKSPNRSMGGDITEGASQYIPYGMAGGASLGGQLAAGAASGAAQTEPDQENFGGILPNGRLGGAIEGAGENLLGAGVGKLINGLRPSQMFRGNLSPSELQSNLEAAEGTNTGLGDVIGSPALKRLNENVLPRVPFSGAEKVMQKTASQLTEKGEKHLENLGGTLPQGDQTKILQDALKKASNEATKEKNADYAIVNNIADTSGLIIKRDSFNKKANDILSEIEQSPELKREFPQDLLKDIESYAKNGNGNSLKLSNIFKGKLNDKANELYADGKNYESRLFKDLKDSLGEDIESGIKSSGNPELQNAYDKAQKNYGSKYKQFEDKDITKFTRQGGDTDMILSHFLRTGANDRSTLLAKVTTKLPKELQNLPAYMYLSKAIEDGQLNPVKLRTLYDKLGNNQKKSLIPDAAMRKELDKYTKSVGMNTEAFQTMFNPKTGQRALDTGVLALQGLTGLSLGNIPGALAGLILPGMAAKGAVHTLSSPAIRESLIKAMMKNKSWKKQITGGAQIGAQTSSNS